MIDSLKTLIGKSRNIVVFTGAGVSTLSGIRDFRGPEGLYKNNWNGLSVEDILSIDYFMQDPSTFYSWAKGFVYQLENYQPNIVHIVLGRLAEKGYIRGVYTQNIDLLHQKGGVEHVWELHGSPSIHHCLSCGKSYAYSDIAPMVRTDRVPYCEVCRGIIKPDIIFYGEQLDHQLLNKAYQDMAEADLVIILGSSLTVQPAAGLPMAAYYHGGKLVIVNADETPLDRYASLRFFDLKDVFEKLSLWVEELTPRNDNQVFPTRSPMSVDVR